jgi:hypothetical protein
MLGGSVVMRELLTGDPITPRTVRRVVDSMLDGIASRS